MKIFDLLSLKSFEEGSPESSFEDKRLLDKNQRFLTLNFLNRNFKNHFISTLNNYHVPAEINPETPVNLL